MFKTHNFNLGDCSWHLGLRLDNEYSCTPLHGHYEDKEQQRLHVYLSKLVDGQAYQCNVAGCGVSFLGADGRVVHQSRVHVVV